MTTIYVLILTISGIHTAALATIEFSTNDECVAAGNAWIKANGVQAYNGSAVCVKASRVKK